MLKINMKNVLIFRSHLLPFSNTFVKEQIEKFKSFKPHLIGTKRVNELNIDGIESLTISDYKGLSTIHRILFAGLSYAPNFYRTLERLEPKLVHSHFGSDAMMAMKISDQLNIPLITTFHGYDICTYPEMASHYNHKLMFKKFDTLVESNRNLIAVSDFIKEKLIDKGAAEEKIIRHYIGVDIEKFPNRPEKKVKRILFVGRLVEKKGCRYLIEAFKDFSKYFPEYELTIVGSGPLEKQLRSLANSISNKITFAGRMPHQEVIKMMATSEIFCAPSVIADDGDAEALGLVFAEAQASYTPVVSFSTGGISEVVQHESTGFLAKSKDVKELASYLKKLADDESLRQSYGMSGRKFINSNHNLEVQSKILEKIYERIG